jgi:hypothetical protein
MNIEASVLSASGGFVQNPGNTSWACRLFSKNVLQDTILNYKEVSDAILAALVIHDNRNCGGQFFCGSDLEQTIRFQFAQLCWRCHRRFDSSTLLGAIETQEVEGELTRTHLKKVSNGFYVEPVSPLRPFSRLKKEAKFHIIPFSNGLNGLNGPT